jgi:leucyl aminopeptidase (aminopeptidase T)
MVDPASPRVLPSFPEATRRALARNILVNTLRLKRGENLLIDTWTATLPWALSAVLEARIIGARPMLVVEDEETFFESVKEAPAAHVGQVGTHDWAAIKASDAFLFFYGPLSSERERELPRSVRDRIESNDHEWFRVVEKSGVRSARWDLGRTSEVTARHYGVDLALWRRELVEAAVVDPRTLQQDGARVGKALQGRGELRITHPNGTDLTLRVVGRRPKIDDGVIDDADIHSGNVYAVLPSGVASVSVDETFAEGRFVANIPGVMFAEGLDTTIAGATWTFRHGRLSEYAFEQGEAEFRAAFRRLGQGKDRPGFISIGLNPRITSIPLLFDQEKGVLTLAIGRNSHVGGKTRTPHFTAFQSIRGATVELNGRLIVDGGQLA